MTENIFNSSNIPCRRCRCFSKYVIDTFTRRRRPGTTRGFALGRRRRDGTLLLGEGSSGSASASGEGSDSESGEGSMNGVVGGTVRPPRKQRRGNRNGRRARYISAPSGSTVVANGKKNTHETGPKLGEDYQAEVDPEPTYNEARGISRADTYPAQSQLVFRMTQPHEIFSDGTNTIKDKLKSKDKTKFSLSPKVVSEFEQSENLEASRYTGFPLSPFAMEVAWSQLFKARGNTSQAHEQLWRILKKHCPNLSDKIHPGNSTTTPFSFYPGLPGPITHDEYCRFVRALTEHGKDFWGMAVDLAKCDDPQPIRRTRSHLVWLYYARHKQWRLQGSRAAEASLVVDNGSTDQLKACPLTSFRAVHMLHILANSGNDGFPPDRRLTQIIKAARDRAVSAERRRREAETRRRPPRIRS